MTVAEICASVEAWAPPSLAFEGDPCGLSVGAPGREVKTVLATLTITGDVVAMAKKRHADMIVSHHPLIYAPLRRLCGDDPHTKLCLELVRADIACFAAHTNLDIAPGGVNDILADRIGLKNRTPLLPVPQSRSGIPAAFHQAACAQTTREKSGKDAASTLANRQVKLVTFVPEAHLAAVREAICLAGAGNIGDYAFCTFSTPGEGTFLPNESSKPFSGRKGQLNEEPERRIETLVSEYRLSAVIEAMKKAHPYEEVAYDVIPVANKDPKIGIGVQGEIDRAVSLQAFSAQVCAALEIPHARVVGDLKKKVKRVAILGGSGGGDIGHIEADIDVFVTGDVKYHNAMTAMERGLALVDAGHAGTEKWIVPAIADYLKKRFKKLQVITFTEPEIFQVVTF